MDRCPTDVDQEGREDTGAFWPDPIDRDPYSRPTADEKQQKNKFRWRPVNGLDLARRDKNYLRFMGLDSMLI